VEFIMELPAEGWSEDDILRNYPHITHEDVIACLDYACAILKSETAYPLSLRNEMS
jgi:uncharacterized protein (DUF433 family)